MTHKKWFRLPVVQNILKLHYSTQTWIPGTQRTGTAAG
jgi:hypothetical protein